MSNEMTAFISRRVPTNLNLPRLTVTEDELAILQMSPSMWVDSSKGVSTSGGFVSEVRDRTGKTSWSPLTASKLRTVNSNGIPVLRFGRGTPDSGSMLASDEYESLPENGIYSLALVFRAPVPNAGDFGPTGGVVVGSYAPPAEALRIQYGSDSYQSDVVFLRHGGSYPIQAEIPGFRNGNWHTTLIEVTSGSHRWEHDGVLLKQSNTGAEPFPTVESRRLVIGGATNPLTVGLQGDIAAVLLVPGALSATQKERIYSYMNKVKDSLTE